MGTEVLLPKITWMTVKAPVALWHCFKCRRRFSEGVMSQFDGTIIVNGQPSNALVQNYFCLPCAMAVMVSNGSPTT